MPENRVQTAGAMITTANGQYHTVRVWHKLEGHGRIQETEYSELTWTEAVDVILAELHGRRPGWALGDGWSQPPLPFSES